MGGRLLDQAREAGALDVSYTTYLSADASGGFVELTASRFSSPRAADAYVNEHVIHLRQTGAILISTDLLYDDADVTVGYYVFVMLNLPGATTASMAWHIGEEAFIATGDRTSVESFTEAWFRGDVS